MAHFAKLDEENNVIGVHVVSNDAIIVDGNESEQAGIDFLSNLHGHSKWKQTSYNGSFRKNYAGIGYIYDETLDAFIAPKPFESWVLNENTCQWEAPISCPEDGKTYHWNEDAGQWIEFIPIIQEPVDNYKF
jgi:hypothetical protein